MGEQFYRGSPSKTCWATSASYSRTPADDRVRSGNNTELQILLTFVKSTSFVVFCVVLRLI